jgi:ABC-type sugar transport system substrate-binding protein
MSLRNLWVITQPGSRRRTSSGAVALACLVAVVAGCSSSSSSSQAAASSAPPASSSAASGSTSPAAGAAGTVTTRPASIPLTTPLGGPVPKAKTIDVVTCGVPACTENVAFLKAGTDALGWKLNVISGGTTTESAQAAWESVVANPPDAAVGFGYDPTIFAAETKKLAAMHIPDLQFSTGYPASGGVNAVLFNTPEFEAMGSFLAQYVTTQSGVSAATSVLFVYPPVYQVNHQSYLGFKAEFSSICGPCQLASLPVLVTSIGSTLPSQVVGYVSAHPGVKYVITAFSDMTAGLPQALQAAGLSGKVKLLTLDDSPSLAPLIENGQVQATVQQPWETITWLALDYFMRVFDNKPTSVDLAANAKLPLWIVTKSNLPAGSATAKQPVVAGYQAQFEQLWGLS